jgi:serine/threonine-protein kinase
MGCLETNMLAGTSVSHYSIRDLIGSGGMGKVYVARDERLCRDVAIKVMDGAQRRPEWPGLMGEARMLSRLNHPNVAAVYELISSHGTDYLVMEFVPGPTVRQLLGSGPLPMREVMRLGRQLASGLAAIHAAGVIHRDIKPENLKVTASGDVKILDFGVARPLQADVLSTSATTSGAAPGVVGTLQYMSPEQLRGEETDERGDIYSTGALLYEMAAGRAAFPQRQIACLIDAVLHDRPADLRMVNPSVPAAFAELVSTALAKRPENRPQRARDVGESLDEIARALARPARAPKAAGVLRAALG